MDINDLLSKHSDNYRFHGTRGWLDTLVSQSKNGEIKLWGTDHNDAVDEDEYSDYMCGDGYLYCTDINGIEVCFNDFSEGDDVVLVLEKNVENPQEWSPRAGDRRELLIRVEEWSVIGGVRPIFDEDGDVIELEAIDIADIIG